MGVLEDALDLPQKERTRGSNKIYDSGTVNEIAAKGNCKPRPIAVLRQIQN
jgi:hypothetical protein